MEKFLDDLLYYKGFGTYAENAQMNYKFQSLIYFKLTQNEQYKVLETYKISCPMHEKITEVPVCLKQDILKICNIETRRNVISQLQKTSDITLNLFKTITTDEKTLNAWMSEYYNLVYQFIILIRESDLMNPINSSMFMQDWYLFEEMNGRQLGEVNEVPKPYPLPFP